MANTEPATPARNAFRESFEAAVPGILSRCLDYDRLRTLTRLHGKGAVSDRLVFGKARWGLDACLERGEVRLERGMLSLTPSGEAEFARLDGSIGAFSRSLESEDDMRILMKDLDIWDALAATALAAAVSLAVMPAHFLSPVAGAAFLLASASVGSGLLNIKCAPPRKVGASLARSAMGALTILLVALMTAHPPT